jgi:hypothetical protein
VKRPTNPEVDLGTIPRDLVAELGKRSVLRPSELITILSTFRRQWPSGQRVTLNILIAWMLEHTRLHLVSIRSELHGPMVRYVWGEASQLEIAASLAVNGYFSHATAASLHGLLTYNPETIYFNREQSAKPIPDGPLRPEGIARAFSKKQRATRDVYSWSTTRVAVLSGKQSGRLGVEQCTVDGSQQPIDVTSVERTLIDLTVRPDYAGGPLQVLEAFKKARGRVEIDRLAEMVERLEYRYPYHQAIGFYMERATYPADELAKLSALGIHLDFYVGYGITERGFDARWRVHFPKDL